MDLIDQFNFEDHNRHVIQINEDKKKTWDIDETKNMLKLVGKTGNIYLIRNTKNKQNVLKMLDFIDGYIKCLKMELSKKWHEQTIDFSCLHGAILFIITPCTIQEMPRNYKFDGLNKPKNIVKLVNYDNLRFKKDSMLRAGNRHIMLTICENGKLRSWEKIKRLLLHELAHTMCNHVTYREEGNHLEDFHMYEKFLNKFTSTNSAILRYEHNV